MQEKIFPLIIIFTIILFIHLYLDVFSSSLRLENNKALFNAKYIDAQSELSFSIEEPVMDRAFLPDSIGVNPAEVELYLRSQLIERTVSHQFDDLMNYYEILLKVKPTWPYFYSGLVQLEMQRGVVDKESLNKAIEYGYHEKQVMNSLAEILFYNWEKLLEEDRLKLLMYLIDQNDIMIAGIVNISTKFAKIYVYCDFIYEKKHVEYPACKDQYWQPLKD